MPGTGVFHDCVIEFGLTAKWYVAMAIRPPAKVEAKMTRLFFILFKFEMLK
jgi:hypothetical protein